MFVTALLAWIALLPCAVLNREVMPLCEVAETVLPPIVLLRQKRTPEFFCPPTKPRDLGMASDELLWSVWRPSGFRLSAEG